MGFAGPADLGTTSADNATRWAEDGRPRMVVINCPAGRQVTGNNGGEGVRRVLLNGHYPCVPEQWASSPSYSLHCQVLMLKSEHDQDRWSTLQVLIRSISDR